MSFLIGVDLGQTYDYTAFAVLDERPDKVLEVRHLERHRNRPYPVLVDRLREIVDSLAPRIDPPALAVDATGVGRPVVDMIESARMEADVHAITISAGDTAVKSGRDWRVPKRDLVSTVAVFLQTGRLRIARKLRDAPVLERELRAFRAKISLAGNDTYEAWRESDHDDLVLAVALAAWTAENGRNGYLMWARQELAKIDSGRR